MKHEDIQRRRAYSIFIAFNANNACDPLQTYFQCLPTVIHFVFYVLVTVHPCIIFFK